MINDENKKKMTEARKDALAKGHYVKAYEKKSREMKGKPHGRGGEIAKSHRAKKSVHPSARHHCLESPEGIFHEFDNAEFFVRDHPEMFEEQDRIERKKPNGKLYTRAGNGLQAVSNGSKRQWKGWFPHNVQGDGRRDSAPPSQTTSSPFHPPSCSMLNSDSEK